MANKTDRTGEQYTTNEGCIATIIEYYGWDNVTIEFQKGQILKNITVGNLKVGGVKNPYHLSVFGVGYIGIGEYKPSVNNKNTKMYETWYDVFRRSYSQRKHDKNPSYIGCSVHPDWHCFQNFGKWFEENYKPEYMEDWHLDKDILIRGNKVYSPETCCFVPQEINTIILKRQNNRGKCLIGVNKVGNRFQAKCCINTKQESLGYFDTELEAFQVYKEAKETEIKRLTNKWKPYLTEDCYQALMAYQVEITD